MSQLKFEEKLFIDDKNEEEKIVVDNSQLKSYHSFHQPSLLLDINTLE